MYVYDTVTAAINGLRERGYTMDFNQKGFCLECNGENLHVEDFDIAEVYRFEGPSDPADEAVVYGIQSKNGKKGILVDGFGPSANPLSADMIKKLSYHAHHN
jgi:hypothetical protein